MSIGDLIIWSVFAFWLGLLADHFNILKWGRLLELQAPPRSFIGIHWKRWAYFAKGGFGREYQLTNVHTRKRKKVKIGHIYWNVVFMPRVTTERWRYHLRLGITFRKLYVWAGRYPR